MIHAWEASSSWSLTSARISAASNDLLLDVEDIALAVLLVHEDHNAVRCGGRDTHPLGNDLDVLADVLLLQGDLCLAVQLCLR